MSMASKIVYILIAITAVLGFLSSPAALVLGFVYRIVFDHPFQKYLAKSISYLLKISVVGLGFSMFADETLRTTVEGFNLTLLSIFSSGSIAFILIKILKIDSKLGHLITSGTLICGGSAIAAVSAVIKAKGSTISIALALIFIFNSIALLVFPPIGHYLSLTQEQFGLWCAVAIHDTSSVVGAGIEYGEESLKVATIVKLSRTLWIIPLSICSMFIFKTKGEKIKIPYFIILFLMAICINSIQILPEDATHLIVLIAKRLLIMTLFLVGTSISIHEIKSTSVKPIVFAVILWVFISTFSLIYILNQ